MALEVSIVSVVVISRAQHWLYQTFMRRRRVVDMVVEASVGAPLAIFEFFSSYSKAIEPVYPTRARALA